MAMTAAITQPHSRAAGAPDRSPRAISTSPTYGTIFRAEPTKATRPPSSIERCALAVSSQMFLGGGCPASGAGCALMECLLLGGWW